MNREEDPAPAFAPDPSQRRLDVRRRTIPALGPVARWPDALLHAVEMIDLARQPMAISWGPDRLIIHNEAYAPIVSGKPDAEGRPMHEVFAEAWDVIGGLLARAEAGEGVHAEDLEASITRDGRTAPSWWNVSFSPLPVRSGEVGGVLCMVQETTRAHLAEARAAAVEAELTLVTDVVPSLLWRADRFGRTVWQNARLKALTIDSGADAANMWRKLVHVEDLEAILAELAAAKAQRRAFAKVLRLRMSSTQYRWHLARSEPVFGEGGVLTGWCGVATDIQASIDALETLERRAALLRQFAANSSSLLWMVDLGTLRVDRLSPNFSVVWPQIEPGASWTWPEFLSSVHEADRPVLAAGLDKVAGGEAVSGRFRVVTPTGGIRLLEGRTFPIVTSDGRIPCIGGVLQDITRDVRRTAHLVDADPGSQNRLSHGLRRLGFEVTVFDSIDALTDVAAGMSSGPLIYHHQGDAEALTRLAGVMKTTLAGAPWMVVQAGDRPAREAVSVMKLGACDILDVDAPMEVVAAALDTAASTIRGTAAASVPPRSRYRLTSRELQIAQGLVAGGTNKTIAQSLGISPRTVESHRGRLMERLNVSSLAELVALVTSPTFDVDIKS